MKNDAKCAKCGDEIVSKFRHDFVTCKCGAISVDGGKDYMRRCGNPEDFLPVTQSALRTKSITMKEYNAICDRIIGLGLPVHETLIKLLAEAGQYKISRKAYRNCDKTHKKQLKMCKTPSQKGINMANSTKKGQKAGKIYPKGGKDGKKGR